MFWDSNIIISNPTPTTGLQNIKTGDRFVFERFSIFNMLIYKFFRNGKSKATIGIYPRHCKD